MSRDGTCSLARAAPPGIPKSTVRRERGRERDLWYLAPMRRAPILGATLLALLATLAQRAGAFSPCDEWGRLFGLHGTVTWDPEWELPVDAVPWTYADCGSPLPDICVLQAGEQLLPVTIETTGEETCANDDKPLLKGGYRSFIRRFVPDEPLAPATTYRVDCGDADWVSGLVVRTRASTAPSAPPGTLEILAATLEQGDDGCCGVGDYLEVRFEGLSGPYLDEGGYIEVLFPRGEVAALGDGVPRVDLPPVDGTIRFTPVAADGRRGATVELDTADVREKAVYLPCAVDPRGSSLALWLLAPLAWVGTQTRRRERR